MSTEDFVDCSPTEAGERGPRYIELALLFDEADAAELEEPEPIERLVGLMSLGDKYVLDNSGDDFYNEDLAYSLAVESVMDPLIQLELGCLLLQRADTNEGPFCEHKYQGPGWDWEPEIRIHDEVGDGPPCGSWARERVLRAALRAYGNAWDFYRYKGGRWVFFRSLFALDGMRVAYEALDDITQGWNVCDAFERWLRYCEYDSTEWKPERAETVAQLRVRFALTKGRLEPMMIGRSKALEALERQFAWWDMIPVDVRDYLADADYMRSNLKDPTYNPKGIVTTYCYAIEAMLHRRLGDVVDSYLNKGPSEEIARFKAEFLQNRKDDKIFKEWKCADLTINQFARNLRKPSFKTVLSKVGADATFCFQELPRVLEALLDSRNPASHAHKRLFSDEGVVDLRTTVLDLIGKLAQVRVILTSTQSNDG